MSLYHELSCTHSSGFNLRHVSSDVATCERACEYREKQQKFPLECTEHHTNRTIIEK